MSSFLREFWSFMLVRKRYWLLPIVVATILFGGLLVLTNSPVVAPFIYAIF